MLFWAAYILKLDCHTGAERGPGQGGTPIPKAVHIAKCVTSPVTLKHPVMAWRESHQLIFIYLLFSPLSFSQRLLQGLQFNDGHLYHGPGPFSVLFRLLLCSIQLGLDRHKIFLCFLLQLLQIVSGFS